jgi:O6-methylguanine-DNA--protein-cysteine methyltransferase
VLVPCHRVLAANKKIGGFSNGLAWKRRLLAREGVKV